LVQEWTSIILVQQQYNLVSRFLLFSYNDYIERNIYIF
jgi:hypothetical protein